tara:strand:+ start:4049 stop:5038 length:990 start_codon:yes stop_codon:yes gene_type:complete
MPKSRHEIQTERNKNMSNKTDKKITGSVKNWTVSDWASNIRRRAAAANGLHYGIALEAIRLTDLGGTWQDITGQLKNNFGHTKHRYKVGKNSYELLALSRLVERVGVRDFAPASKLTLGIRTLRIAINAGVVSREQVARLTNATHAAEWASENNVGLITPTEDHMAKAWEITKSKQKNRNAKAWDLLQNAHVIPEQIRAQETAVTDSLVALKKERKKAPESQLPAIDKKIDRAQAALTKSQVTNKRHAVLRASGVRVPKQNEPETTGDGFALGSECRKLIKQFKTTNDIEIFASAFTPSMDNELALVIDALTARQTVLTESKKKVGANV